MIRLRQSLEAGLRHPLLGPLLLLALAFVLAFVVIHVVGHGVEGLLVTCAVLVAVAVRLVVVLGRTWRPRPARSSVAGRSPPRYRPAPLSQPPPLTAFAAPLRR